MTKRTIKGAIPLDRSDEIIEQVGEVSVPTDIDHAKEWLNRNLPDGWKALGNTTRYIRKDQDNGDSVR